MGKMLKFSLDDPSSLNNFLRNCSFSTSLPTTSLSGKQVSLLLLVFLGFSSILNKSRSVFCFSRFSNSLLIRSNSGDNL
ncbi:hypothetical protein HanRHA438_Chr13g0626281 [Helianthus annuus]|nr:hypothetical protein HanRHA438_Chr13g0626281 [Helianthus annuus]